MGLCLFPDDDDATGPDISWSYSGFAAFRRRLAEAEGIALSQMWGFGGDRPWSSVSTPLEPFLDHPDDDGELSAAECAAILPRLETVIAQWQSEATRTPLLQAHIDDARQLVIVLLHCVQKNVVLQFA
ncbi:hypothetical protein [Streptomyces sp. NPDC050804]|uniref:hypothetical protein n=1 Tax=Streptomyces sp. NPDC050804 TaxID=3154745 RepID=UPI0034405C00